MQFRGGPGLIIGMLVFFAGWPLLSRAGALTTVADYLVRQQAGLTSGQLHQVFFTPATALPGTGNTVELRFPTSNNAMWCTTAGAITVNGIIAPDGGGVSATPLPGTLSANCQPGSGGHGDYLTVSGVGPLQAGTEYGYALSDGSGQLGTPPPEQGIGVFLVTTNGTTDVDTQELFLSTLASDQVVVTATVVGNTPPLNTNPVVSFSGLASPGGQVAVSLDGQTVTTLTAGSDAAFSVTLTDQPLGAHLYVVTGKDVQNSALAPVTFGLNLAVNTTTFINGVFLGPSIRIDQSSVKLGATVTLSGSTAPASAVTITLSSNPLTTTATADVNGLWVKSVNTNALGTGTHTAKARAVVDGSDVSAYSSSLTFVVNPLAPCDGKQASDLNCDGRVDIIDFSVLLFFWHQHNPANSRADINKDGLVNITDFSIMLYQWTG